jgi:NADPH:quinone reductase-like Zn-dependent oxidoreductase
VPLGGLEALHFISKANLQKGQSILINGAGGSIGTMAIQLAKQLGAEVTAVDHTDKLDMMRAIGADHVIDYTKEDFAKMGRTYDVIFDVICKDSFARSLKSLNNDGRYLMGNPRLSTMLRSLWVTRGSNKKIIFETNVHKSKNLIYLRDMIEAGQLKTVIDRVYPLEETADAHRYVETGQKKGNVIVQVTSSI